MRSALTLRLLAGSAFVCALASSRLASAEDQPTAPTPPSEAAQHFARGTQLYNEGRFADALQEFESAHAVAPHPSNLFNMARCMENLGDFALAVTRYREALEGTADATDRADIERRISGIEQRPVRVFVTTEPAGAAVLVDAREEPEPSLTPVVLELAPGPHRLLLSLDGYHTTSRRVVVQVGQEQPVAVQLAQARAAECPAAPPCPTCPTLIRTDGVRPHLALGARVLLAWIMPDHPATVAAGITVRAHLTRNNVIFGGTVSAHPSGERQVSDDPDTGARRFEHQAFVDIALESGYRWIFGHGTVDLTGGLGVFVDAVTQRTEGEEQRDTTSTSMLYGFARVNVEAYMVRWLSVGFQVDIGFGSVVEHFDPILMNGIMGTLALHM